MRPIYPLAPQGASARRVVTCRGVRGAFVASTSRPDVRTGNLTRGAGCQRSCSALAASGERSYTTATFVAARELGLRRARGSSHVESNRRFQAAYLCAQPPLLQEHPLPTQRLRGYDKVFASAWLDCDTLVVGTKDNKVYNAGSRHQDSPNSGALPLPAPSRGIGDLTVTSLHSPC